MRFKSADRKRHAAWHAAVAALVLAAAAAIPDASAQYRLDERLIGTWVQAGTSTRISIRKSGEILVDFPGPQSVFNGRGSIERCTEGGANACLTGTRFRCAYRYTFFEGGLNLQWRGGGANPCEAASGDYRRLDRGDRGD